MRNCMVFKSIPLIDTIIIKTWNQGHLKMARQYSARWVFNTKNWRPSEQEILSASSLIQSEEKERISKFVFLDDAKSSLIGRLMMRKYIQNAVEMSNRDIVLNRDSRGKPVLAGFENQSPHFNISHQGDYVVLAGDMINKVGIDVMQIETPVDKNVQEFFRLMTRQFSSKEWETIRSYDTEMKQVASFYRHWCLKESYVKNIGVGITIKLSDISFTTKSELSQGEIVLDSILHEQNLLKRNWVFEETLIDDKHAVAVATSLIDVGSPFSAVKFRFVSFEELVIDIDPLTKPDFVFKKVFLNKKNKIIPK